MITSTFWRNIWSVPDTHIEGDGLRDVRRLCESITHIEPVTIDRDDVSCAVRSLEIDLVQTDCTTFGLSGSEAHMRVWHLNSRQHWIQVHYP
ncbi:unnamed protein product [Arctia plantaginis]|uniref:Uncharacterized protein n=1 Tax=Arctia plantaginis TaxID=874455 RepID=A0A8S0ZPC9_ARCPL|nr:unnamed protein product [Arctia plantaginis]